MDAKDKMILSLLQEDSTISVKDVAEKIGLTFTPTYERIKQLEKQNVIEKYVLPFLTVKNSGSISSFIATSG
ncbi:Lrp/AsnC family transcriptional regulator [Halpernia sp. GG3]